MNSENPGQTSAALNDTNGQDTQATDSPERILLVDDNPTNLQVLLQTLSGRGYKLLVAKNGESALNIAHKGKPALVLLDIMMPGIDGYEVCRRLKEDPETSDITVIFLSALDDTRDKVKGLETGAVDFISKPFQAEEVIARVETQLKIHRLEQALSSRNRQLEAENQRILESMSEGIFGFDAEGTIIFANPAACHMTGLSETEAVGAPLTDMLKPQCTANNAVASLMDKMLTTGESGAEDDVLIANRSGEAFDCELACNPIFSGEALNGGVMVFRDITEKKRQQAALDKALEELKVQQEKVTHVSRLSTMGEMAAGFAHEVNQPLTAISNYAQVSQRLMKREPLDTESLIEAMEKISSQARRAGGIISRIRSFVKKPDHCLEKVDCNRLVQDVVRLAEVDARNNGIEIHSELAETLPAVRVDPVQIQQVALNLLRNGMEAMRDAPGKTEGIRISTVTVNDEFVEIAVKDRGHGLAEGAEEKLFTPFYTTKSDGMGIGLSVCMSIIQTHGGKLWADRNPEGGTTFSFTLPIA
ncbi:ATP-binding response regulator [Endozoicomonadaceae bacterium StTr2]